MNKNEQIDLSPESEKFNPEAKTFPDGAPIPDEKVFGGTPGATTFRTPSLGEYVGALLQQEESRGGVKGMLDKFKTKVATVEEIKDWWENRQ